MKLKQNLTLKILLGMLIGILIGGIGGSKVAWLQIFGEIFLRLLQMIVIPLVTCSVISAVGHFSVGQFRKIGMQMVMIFLATTIAAAVVGLLVGLPIRLNLNLASHASGLVHKQSPSISDTILSFFPQNIFEALSAGQVIQITIFAIICGFTIMRINRRGQFDLVLGAIDKCNHILIEMMNTILIGAPLGICSLLIGSIATNGIKILFPLLMFIIIYAVAVILFLIGLICICSFKTQVSPFKIFLKCSRIILIAATTASSAAALPMEMLDANKRLGIGESVRELVLPLGMTLNSNGLSMYLGLASVTMLQLFGVPLTVGIGLKIIMVSTLACLGTVVIPGGGLVSLAIVLPTLGLPISGVGIIAGADWLIGIFRTILNVMGDVTTSIMIAKDEHSIDLDRLKN